MLMISFSLISTNECDLTDRCISFIAKNIPSSISYEILLVDNASSDGTFELLSTKYPKVMFHRNKIPKGFSFNHNLNISRSNGKYVLIMNSDVIIKPGFIENLMNSLKEDALAGIACGKLLRADEKTIDSTGHLIFKNRRTVDRGQDEEDKGQYNNREEVFSACGAAMLCKKEMLEDIKLNGEYFDNSFFMCKEDIDLCWRARLRGWKVIYEPDAVAIHLRGWTKGKKRTDIPRYLRGHSFKNRHLMMIKCDHIINLMLHFPYIIWYELRALVYILFREPYLLLIYFFIAVLLPLTLRKRSLIMKTSKVRAREIRRWFI